MVSGHTPGPWYVPSFAPWQVNPEGALPGSAVLAECHEDRHTGRIREERNANARLMAAAPDLLDAAEAVLEAFGEDVWTGQRAQALDKVMDAINKAEGVA